MNLCRRSCLSPREPTSARRTALGALLLAALAEAGLAQSGVTVLPKGAVPQQVIDLPELPRLMALSPRDSVIFADRDEVRPAIADYPPGTGPSAASTPTLVDVILPASLTGTGIAEPIQYQLPTDDAPGGEGRPMLVAWHGFGASAKSVAPQTTLDEQCQSWGWIFLSVTGVDDKLFGPPVSQQNVEVAMNWMLDNFDVDPDRLYMVGFSMGAGIVANFAARHRDPEGLMIAGLGLVSGSFDWTTAYSTDTAVQIWMQNPWNFGGSPQQVPFAYQRSSDLHFDPATYPPAPGELLALAAMANNLRDVPAYVTWDIGDTLAYLPPQSEVLGQLLASMGADPALQPASGTVNPATGQPATHSWAVLDEQELFNRLAPLEVVRLPPSFDAQLERDAAVSFVRVTQRQADAFTRISGRVEPQDVSIEVDDVANAREVELSVARAGLSGQWPLRIRATSADDGFLLLLTDTDRPASYLLDTLTGALIDAVESDPIGNSLALAVPAGGSVDVLAFSVPWTAGLALLPDPAPTGAGLQLVLTSEAGSTAAWVIVGLSGSLLALPGGLLVSVPPWPPALLIGVPLDSSGGAQLPAQLPDNPALSGLSLLLQAVILGPGSAPAEVSNCFRFDIL